MASSINTRSVVDKMNKMKSTNNLSQLISKKN